MNAEIASTMSERPSSASVSLWLLASWLAATMSLWFFAFYSMPGETADWVRRAQIACFGSDESGLPGPAGWMLLALSPIMFLGALVLSLGDELFSALKRVRASWRGSGVLWAIMSFVALEALWVGYGIYQRIELSQEIAISADRTVLPRTYPRGQSMAADFSLVNQHGERESLRAQRGKPVLLTFVFAHCQAVCPALVQTVRTASSAQRTGQVHAMFLTLDPWRDTPASLPNLARKWELGPGMSVLSGSPEEVTAVLDAYEVPRERDNKTGDVVHPALVHVIAPDGTLAYSFNSPSVAWLTEAVSRLAQ